MGPSSFEADPIRPGSHVGELLRSTRERLGEPLEAVASALRIRPGYLEDIEAGRFESLPNGAYAVGFIRAYADHLGLHSEEVVRRFRNESRKAAPSASRPLPAPSGDGGPMPRALLILSALVLAACAYGAWYWVSMSERTLAERVPDLPERLKALVEPLPGPDDEDGSGDDGAAAVSAPEPGVPSNTGSGAAPLAGEDNPDHVAETPAFDDEADTGLTGYGEEAVPGESAAASLGDSSGTLPFDPANDGAGPFRAEDDEPDPDPVDAGDAPEETGAGTASAEGVPDLPAAPAGPASSLAADTASRAPLPPSTRPGKPAAPPRAETRARASAAVPAVSAPVPSGSPSSPVSAPSSPAAADTPDTVVVPAPEILPSEPRIVLRASRDSWIELRRNNALLTRKFMRTGDVYIVPEGDAITLSASNAGGLEVYVDGLRVPALGPPGVARDAIPMTPDRLRRIQP